MTVPIILPQTRNVGSNDETVTAQELGGIPEDIKGGDETAPRDGQATSVTMRSIVDSRACGSIGFEKQSFTDMPRRASTLARFVSRLADTMMVGGGLPCSISL